MLGRITLSGAGGYVVPGACDAAPVSVEFVGEPWDGGPHGAKGLSEATVPSIAPAIVAAIANATGTRLTELPATPERLLSAMKLGGPFGE